jgi:chromosome transmission fidelity protein 18
MLDTQAYEADGDAAAVPAASAAPEPEPEAPPPPLAPLPRVSAGDIDGPCITVTGANGTRVYCPLAPPAPRGGRVPDDGARVGAAARLLPAPLAQLTADAERDALERALVASEAREAAACEAAAGEADPSLPPPSSRLWVDAHAPSTFMDLLSDEGVNRQVLRWVAAWRRATFGGPAPAARGGAPAASALASRPTPRLLLIAGPPGLGKTTLAHVVARHCGYRPVEVNASDARGAAALAARVRDATEARSVVPGARPNCVIVDEVDGVVGGPDGRSAVAALLRLVHAGDGHAAGGGAGEPSATATTRRRRGPAPLRRPIVCIANDAFAPALRGLRPHALVVRVPPPPTARLVARLAAVAAAEGVTVERRALVRLAVSSRGDVRACLHSLQLLARRAAGGAVTDAAAARLASASKDARGSVLDLVADVLCARAGGGGASAAARAAAPASASSSSPPLWDALADHGDADLVLRALHETLPAARVLDGAARRVAAAADALSAGDVAAAAAGRRGDWSLLRYAPIAPLAVRAAVAGPDRVRARWPAASADAVRARRANASLLSSWLATVTPAARVGLTPAVAASDTLPALLRVLAAPHRPVAAHLLSPAERAALESTVSLLHAYALTFAPRSAESGDLELSPPVDEAAPLAAAALAPRRETALPQPARAVLAAEVAKEGIRRRERRSGTEDSAAAPAPAAARPPSAAAPVPLTVAQRAAESGAARLQAQAALAAAAAPRASNWLEAARGRAARRQRGSGVSAADASAVGAAAAAVKAAAPATATYKFNEGYTNAVRRPLRMADLL